MFAKIRHDYISGPAVEPTPAVKDEGVLARVTVDGWATDDDSESGTPLAVVTLTQHGDIITNYTDERYRYDEQVQKHILDVESILNKLWCAQSAWLKLTTLLEFIETPMDDLVSTTGLTPDQIAEVRYSIAKAIGGGCLDCPCCDNPIGFDYCVEQWDNNGVYECPFCGAKIGKDSYFYS
jgi:hypothetical protein